MNTTPSGGSCPPPRPVHAVSATARTTTAAPDRDTRLRRDCRPVIIGVLRSRQPAAGRVDVMSGVSGRPASAARMGRDSGDVSASQGGSNACVGRGDDARRQRLLTTRPPQCASPRPHTQRFPALTGAKPATSPAPPERVPFRSVAREARTEQAGARHADGIAAGRRPIPRLLQARSSAATLPDVELLRPRSPDQSYAGHRASECGIRSHGNSGARRCWWRSIAARRLASVVDGRAGMRPAAPARRSLRAQ